MSILIYTFNMIDDCVEELFTSITIDFTSIYISVYVSLSIYD